MTDRDTRMICGLVDYLSETVACASGNGFMDDSAFKAVLIAVATEVAALYLGSPDASCWRSHDSDDHTEDTEEDDILYCERMDIAEAAVEHAVDQLYEKLHAPVEASP